MLFALLSALLIVATAQQTGKDPINDVCRRHKHQTCIIDSKLYIDGGFAYYGGSKGNDSVAERSELLLLQFAKPADRPRYLSLMGRCLKRDDDGVQLPRTACKSIKGKSHLPNM